MTALRYARVWGRFFVAALMREVEYRGNTALMVLSELGEAGLELATYLLFYRFADRVAGWTADEALLLLGVFWIYEGIWGGLIGCTCGCWRSTSNTGRSISC